MIRTRTSSVGTVIGITLVLLMLGALGFMLLNARELERHCWQKIFYCRRRLLG